MGTEALSVKIIFGIYCIIIQLIVLIKQYKNTSLEAYIDQVQLWYVEGACWRWKGGVDKLRQGCEGIGTSMLRKCEEHTRIEFSNVIRMFESTPIEFAN